MRSLSHWADIALEVLTPAVRDLFAADPLATMRGALGLTVTEAEHLSHQRSDGGVCDGMSFSEDGVVLYAASPHSKRENFTLAHEVGHWLLAQVPEIYDWLFEQREPGRAEEVLCDLIAQRLLVPEMLIDSVVGDGPVEAAHVTALVESSSASLPVCSIALAQRIPGLGAIVVVRPDPATGTSVVEYASVRPDPVEGWPKVYPWRGEEVPAGHPLRSMSSASGSRAHTTWTNAWGQTAPYYLDAQPTPNRRIVGVLAATDLWQISKLHIEAPREYDTRPTQEINCCGATRSTRGTPCGTCGTIACSVCGYCQHQKDEASLVPCEKCWVAYRPALLVDGRCEDCR